MDLVAVETKWYNDFKDTLPSVEGKVFVITGTTSGTGFVAARTVASKGGIVVLLNRPSSRATKSLEDLKAAVPNGKFIPIECDLQNFNSVRNASKEIKSKFSESGIYCVCWNAGIMGTPDKATIDGYDTQMQTNHLSHFLLTAELLPLLEQYANVHGDARIVNHSSGARHRTKDGLERKYFEKKGGNLGGDEIIPPFSGAPFTRYSQTKLANAVFTQGLHNKFSSKSGKIRAICADPGMSATTLAGHFDDSMMETFKGFGDYIQSAEDGTMGILTGMMLPEAESGKHYGPEKSKGPAVVNPSKPYETNIESINLLWETSEAATGIKLTI